MDQALSTHAHISEYSKLVRVDLAFATLTAESRAVDANASNANGDDGEATADMSLSVIIPVAALMICVSIVTFIGNALVIHAIRTEKRLQTVSNYFIMSLAVADMLIGMIVTPLSMLLFVNDKWILGLPVCQAWLSVDYVCSTASIFNLFVLSLDRYWSITSPLKYIRKRTVKRAAVMISFVWVFSSLWIIPILFWHLVFQGGERSISGDECETEFYNNLIFKIITAAFNFYIPLVVMVYIYIRIYWEIRRRSELAVGRKTYGFKKKSIIDEDARMVTQQLDLTSAQGGSFGDECDYEYESMSTSKEGAVCNDVPKKFTYANRPNYDDCEQLEELLKLKHVENKSKEIEIEDDDDLKENGFQVDSNSNFEMDLSELTSKLSAEAEGENLETQETKIIQNGIASPKLPIRRCASNLEYIPSELYTSKTYEIPDVLKEDTSTSEQTQSKVPPKKRRVRRTVSSQQFEASSYMALQTVKENEEAICIKNPNSVMIQCLKAKSASFPRQKHLQSKPPLVPKTNGDANNSSFSRTASLSRKIGITLQTGIAGETLGKIKRFSLSKEKKALKQLGAIVGCFVICWLPYFVVFMIVSFCEQCVNEHFYYSTIWLGYINSALNPFIYPLCNNNFRIAFRRMLRLKKTKAKTTPTQERC